MARGASVRKPNNDLYQKILNETQSVSYQPQPVSWFCQTLQCEEETAREALQYLVDLDYLQLTKEERYAVSRDARIKVRGTYKKNQDGVGMIIPDIQRRVKFPLFVQDDYTMGANDGDRVVGVIDGYYPEIHSHELPMVVVEDVLEAEGDYMVGEVGNENGKTVIYPVGKSMYPGMPILEEDGQLPEGTIVYAKNESAAYNRKNGALNAAMQQKQKSILHERMGGDYRPPATFNVMPDTYSIQKIIQNQEEQFWYGNGFLTPFSELSQCMLARAVEDSAKKRTDLTKTPAYAERVDLAYAVKQTKNGFVLYVHVPDLIDHIPMGSALDSNFKSRACGKYFMPQSLAEKTGFCNGNSCKAVTAEIELDAQGNRCGVKVYRSAVYCAQAAYERTKVLYALLAQYSQMKHPFVYVVEQALLDLTEKGFFLPYVNIYPTKDWEEWLPSMIELGLEVQDTFEKTVAWALQSPNKTMYSTFFQRLILQSPDYVAGGEYRTVPFANPFTSYLPILTQQAIGEMQAETARTKEQLLLADHIMEGTGAVMPKMLLAEKYNLHNQNMAWARQMANQRIAGTLVHRSPEGAYVYCDAHLGICENMDPTANIGDFVCLTLSKIDTQDGKLYFKQI